MDSLSGKVSREGKGVCAMCGSPDPIALGPGGPLCDECFGPTPAAVIEESGTLPAVRAAATRRARLQA